MDQQQKVLNEPGQLPNLNRTEPAFHFKDTQITLCSDSLKWKRLCMETAVISRYRSLKTDVNTPVLKLMLPHFNLIGGVSFPSHCPTVHSPHHDDNVQFIVQTQNVCPT